MEKIFAAALAKGLSSEGLSPVEAVEITGLPASSIFDLLAITEKVRRRHKGGEVSLCSIVNAKSGLCKEDCSFCAQSVKYSTGSPEYPMEDASALLNAAKEASAAGAREFSIVTSGTRIEKERDVAILSETIRGMRDGPAAEFCTCGAIQTF